MTADYVFPRNAPVNGGPTRATVRARRKTLRLHGSIARDIGVKIVSGKYAAGHILNGEIEASGQLKVSRTAYREAVRILAAKGLVHSRPKVGTQVSSMEQWHLLDLDVLSWIFEFEPEESLLNSLFELRKIIEPASAAFAAQKRTEADLLRMRTALRDMATHSLASAAGQEADREFHSTLLEASENPFLVCLVNGIGAAVTWTTIFKQRRYPLPRDPLPDHERVYKAVAAGDPNAARKAMLDLVDFASQDIDNSRKQKKKTRSPAPQRANGSSSPS